MNSRLASADTHLPRVQSVNLSVIAVNNGAGISSRYQHVWHSESSSRGTVAGRQQCYQLIAKQNSRIWRVKRLAGADRYGKSQER